jgi:hypothetical protein
MNTTKDRLKKAIGELNATPMQISEFTNFVMASLQIDALAQNNKRTPQSGKDQYNALKEIEINCEKLLGNLFSLQSSNDIPFECRDVKTGSLIRNSVYLLNREKYIKEIKSSSILNSNAKNNLEISISEFLDSMNEIELNKINNKAKPKSKPHPLEINDYPGNLIKPIEELKNIAAHAAKIAKPKRGNSSTINAIRIRTVELTRNFILSYKICFKSFPPQTSTTSKITSVFEVYEIFLEAAGVFDLKKHKDTGSFYIKSIKQYKKLLNLSP